jgi:hypothetical protein
VVVAVLAVTAGQEVVTAGLEALVEESFSLKQCILTSAAQ